MLAMADERYTESMAFAQTIRPTGEGLLMFKFDLAQLWFRELLPRLRKRTPVLGLTSRSISSSCGILPKVLDCVSNMSACMTGETRQAPSTPFREPQILGEL